MKTHRTLNTFLSVVGFGYKSHGSHAGFSQNRIASTVSSTFSLVTGAAGSIAHTAPGAAPA